VDKVFFSHLINGLGFKKTCGPDPVGAVLKTITTFKSKLDLWISGCLSFIYPQLCPLTGRTAGAAPELALSFELLCNSPNFEESF
jgi:hypothetical protein